MTAPFKILANQQSYMSISMCRRNDQNGEINSVGCLAFNIEQVVKVFSDLDILTGSFQVIHPQSESLIYKKSISNYQTQYYWKKELTINMTAQENSFFINSIDNILKVYKSEISSPGKGIQQYFQMFELSNVKGFEFTINDDIHYCLLIPIQIADKLNGSNDLVFSEVMVLLYIFRKEEMIKNFRQVIFFLGNIFMAISIIYLIMLIICLLIIVLYSSRFSKFVEFPISSLINRMNSINTQLKEYSLLSEMTFDQTLISRNKEEHTCYELTKLEKYFSNILKILSFNLKFTPQTHQNEALFIYIEAIKHFEKEEDCKSLGSTFSNFATLHLKYFEALNCFNQSLICLEQEKYQLKGSYEEQENKIENSSLAEPKKKQASDLLPWIEKYIYGREEEVQNYFEDIKNPFIISKNNLKSIEFDRLLGYANTLLAWALENQLKFLKDKYQEIGERRNNCFFIIVSSLKGKGERQSQNKLHTESQNRKIENGQDKKLSNKIEESALLKEYFGILKKLVKIAKHLDDDPKRYIIIYLEISRAFLLKENTKKSELYFNLAYHHFLVLFKKFKSNLYGQIKFPQQASSSHSFLHQLNQILAKRFPQEDLNEEMLHSRKSTFRNYAIIDNIQKSMSSPPLVPQQKRKKSSLKGASSYRLQTSPHSGRIKVIQPIQEDQESEEETISLQQRSSIFKPSLTKQKIMFQNINSGKKSDIKYFQFNEKEKMQQNTIAKLQLAKDPYNNHLSSTLIPHNKNTSKQSKQKITSITNIQNVLKENSLINNSSSTTIINLPQQLISNSSFSQNTSLTQLYSHQLDSVINTRPTCHESSLRTVFLMTGNTIGLDENQIASNDEIPPFNVLEQQLTVLDYTSSIFDQIDTNNDYNSQTKTSFSFSIDILYTKIQMQEALIELKKGNISKGCLILTEAFEFAPRYLPSDRLLILDMLRVVMDKFGLDVKSFTKQVDKFNKMKLNISVIVNCDNIYLKRVSKQLYEIYTLSDLFSLIVVNEQFEQYIAPINQSKFKGKEMFISNIVKCLRQKSIKSNNQYFISALTKASSNFTSPKNLQGSNNKLTKNYILIFGDRDCVLKDSTYKLNLFKKLSEIDVKILVFNPQDDKEGSNINISCQGLPFKIRFFSKYYQLLEYFQKKSIKCATDQPFLIEKI